MREDSGIRCSPRATGAGLFLLLLIATLLAPNDAAARPEYRAAFFVAYPSAVGSRLDDVPSNGSHCGACHYRFNGNGTRNFYGAVVEAALPSFPDTDDGYRDAILSIENLDSDADGETNLTEITDLINFNNTPTFPGLTSGNVGQTSQVDLADILPYLTPETTVDTTPPLVTVTSPDGGEAWTGRSEQTVTWTATDASGIASIDIFYRDGESEPWKPIAMDIANSGSFTWFVHHTPSADARVRVDALDTFANVGRDSSNTVFTIQQDLTGIAPTTLRDFDQPGSQPFDVGGFSESSTCASCHGGYDETMEPTHGFNGSMMAQAARDPLFYACVSIAEQDAPSSGDLCLRCHTPFGWLGGRSNPTDGSLLTAFDRDGVACEFCHRMVDPIDATAVSPAEDDAILAALIDVPDLYGNGQYVADPQGRRRGPFADAVAPHAFLESPVHRSSEFCGTCHDVSNPVFERVAGADYALGTLDEAATNFDPAHLMPLERTYSEWKASDFADAPGVYAPEFAGNLPDGFVSTCQDCHMSDVLGEGCNLPGTPTRPDLPTHDMTGGSAWLPTVLDQLYPDEVDPVALADGAARAESMLQRAALLGIGVQDVDTAYVAHVLVTNRTGHKLPTGYPEGRRMWLHVVGLDALDQVVYESGAYDAGTGVLTVDEEATVYEVKLGISPGLAAALGTASGESFHFALNDSVYKDNRIPPLGFSNTAFDAFGGAPVDSEWPGPGPRYADDQNWDQASYVLPATTVRIAATLYYQSVSKEYVEFLRDENTTDDTGQTMYDLWAANGRAAPVAMVTDTVGVDDVATPDVIASAPRPLVVSTWPNPAAGDVTLRLDLERPRPVRVDVFDVTGRRVRTRTLGELPAGPQRIVWEGTDDAGRRVAPGVFFLQITAGDAVLRERIVRLR